MNILNKLTIKHLKMNKKRTIVTIVGIVLSTALMVGIGTIASSFRDNALKQTIKSNGNYHVKMKQVPYENVKYIENNVDVKDTLLEYELGYSYLTGSKNTAKPYLFLEAVNDSYFENIKVTKGRVPQNSTEVILSDHIKSNGGVSFELGDTITLNLGERFLPQDIEYKEDLDQNFPYQEGETLNTSTTKTYTIVGFMSRLNMEPYQAPGYTILTMLEEKEMSKEMTVGATITYKHIKNVHNKTEEIAKAVKLPFHEVDNKKFYDEYLDYNEGLLSFYGESSYTDLNETLFGVIAVVLTLIMIGCAIVIYNSFAISVMERKKQFGLFASIGATKTQLKKTVFYEAFLVSIIGIPIGVLSGIFGIWVVLQITNFLLPDAFSIPLSLSLYPAFIILPIIYMIITILISAYLPARAAAKISPIEAIRLNDDIKIKRKTVKTNRFMAKVFGIEGELARKNMKRNKKKYRITILSLVVSIVLFISFSTFVEYASFGTNSLLEVRDYDIQVQKNTDDNQKVDEVYNKILSLSGIEKSITVDLVNVTLEQFKGTTKEYNKNHNQDSQYANVIVLNSKDYEAYLHKLHLKQSDYKNKIHPILVNQVSDFDYQNMKVNNIKVFPDNKERNVTLINMYTNDEVESITDYKKETFPLTVVDKMPSKMLKADFAQNLKLIISEEMLQLIEEKYQEYSCCRNTLSFIMATDHTKLYEEMSKIHDQQFGENDYSIYIFDVTSAMQLQKNLVFVVGMFLYGFIALVTLIGVTSVFNTINTSMALRRKEFAVLRSVGLTPKGFNKMLSYESILYGLKALLFGIPISLVVVILFHLIFMNVINFSSILIPWKAIVICIIAVFFITFMTMMYATKKIKKENILDAIREENI